MSFLRRPALALIFLAAGCTPFQWVRQGATPEELDQDMGYCQQEAWREAQWRTFMYRPFGPTVFTDGRGRRFVWPNSPFGNPFGDPFMEESRLANFCMRAKGYELEPVVPKKSSE